MASSSPQALPLGQRNGKLLQEDHEALEMAERNFSAGYDELSELQGQDPGMIIAEACAALERYAGAVQNELDAVKEGRTLDTSLAAQVFRTVRGEDPELAGELALIRTALVEWDVDPLSAQALVDAWLQRHSLLTDSDEGT